jgi:Xaa-Pro aminopeptidase
VIAAASAPERPLDRARLCRERHARLVDSLAGQGLDVLVLLGQANVGYATGTRSPSVDQGEALHRRAAAVVTADGSAPAVWTWNPEHVPPHLGVDVRPGVDLEGADGAERLVGSLPPGRLAVDDATVPLWREVASRDPQDASAALAAAKIVKTGDELECIRRAQAINEAAIADVEAAVAPGVPATELTGRFLRRIRELGASGNTVDPVWQVMPASIAAGPYSATGDVVFPTVTTPRRFDAGDVVFVDTGMHYEGYQSDYGHTWVVGWELDEHHREHARRWLEVVDAVLEVTKPGATARDLTRAAGKVYGRRPWLAHLYLAHGTGTDSAEMPYVGTDLGEEFDQSIVLAPGMVLVLEPVVWEDGRGGFRAEEIVAVTDDGAERLSNLRYDRYGVGG